MLSTYN
ncbi:UNVERIFIED_CONTAM: hypothetical protein GTU68_042858 [Idotea baltica]|nr:hypothetical protein [Idotea baltica]